MFELEKVVRPNILALKPYRCARDDYSTGILLDANENTHGPSLGKEALKVMAPSADHHVLFNGAQLERYPDPHQVALKEKLCALRGLSSPSHFYLGVGSDECIDMAVRVFVQPGIEKILVTPPTYGMYSVCAAINDAGIVRVPLLKSFQLDVDGIIDAVKKDPLIKIIILCSPGNPTGTLLKHEDITTILLAPEFKGVVLVDEAYIDFCDPIQGNAASVAKWVLHYPNLIVSQTLSKAFGLAGIRLGMTISSPEIARIFNATKAPYNISTPTSFLASSALDTQGLEVMRTHIDMIKQERAILQPLLISLSFVSELIGAHDANFILARIVDNQRVASNERAQFIYKTLAEEHGVVVRYRGMEMHCQGCLRITIGTRKENLTLMEKLESFEKRPWS